MPSTKALTRLDRLIWVLIFGGLLTLVLALSVKHQDETLGWALALLGAAAAIVGAVLIVVRARLHPSAQPETPMDEV